MIDGKVFGTASSRDRLCMFPSAIDGFVEIGYSDNFHWKVAIFDEKFYGHINFKCLIIM